MATIGAAAQSGTTILTHGWPGSFLEMYNLIPMLTDPENNGLAGFFSFDVVVPSLPGFGFSQAPVRAGMSSRAVAMLWHKLMITRRYPSYFAQGGDIGAGVSTWLARLYPAAVIALHLNLISGNFQPPLSGTDRALSAAESTWIAERGRWVEREGGYCHVHATKPQTLAYSLMDSPTGLAAWILEKFYAWSDGPDDLLQRFDVNDLLTNLSLYWFSGNVAATLRMYKENTAQPLRFVTGENCPASLFCSFPKRDHSAAASVGGARIQHC